MSEIVTGRNMILEINVDDVYIAIGCAVSCSFSFQNEIIGKTDVNAGLFRKRRVRVSDCAASAQGLTTLVNDTTISIMHLLQEGVRRTEQDLRFRFTDDAGVSKQIQGLFLVETVEIAGEIVGFSEFDVSFVNTGGFTISTIEDESGDDLPEGLAWDWWEAAPGETSIAGPGHYGRSFEGVAFEKILEVDREGTQYDLVNDTPEGREVYYDGTQLLFDELLPFIEGTRVFVIWGTT